MAQSQANSGLTSQFIDINLSQQELIKNISDVQCLYIQEEHFILINDKQLVIYSIKMENNLIKLDYISTISLPIPFLPVKCCMLQNMLVIVSTFENKIFLYKNLTQDQITQEIYIIQHRIIDVVRCENDIYAVTSRTIIKLNPDDLTKSEQNDIQLQGEIKLSLINDNDKELIIVTDKRQMLTISLKNYQIIKTQQKVTKTEPLYGAYILKLNKILIIGEGNEIVYLSTQNVKKEPQQEKRITQVKQDFYDTQFRTDGFIYGVSFSDNKITCLTSNFIYYWIMQ